MPIIGLTDREASFPMIGKLRKGSPKQVLDSGKEIQGKDLDYFRLDTQRNTAIDVFQKAYGDTPTEIQCWLPYADVDQNFQTWMEEWKGGGLVRRCDRETQVVWMENNQYKNGEKPCVKECGCKPSGRLKIIIREFLLAGIVGFIEVETHSIHDVMVLTENLNAAYKLRPNLCGIPFVLRRSPREISTPVNGKRMRKTMHMLSIEPDAAWVQKQLQGMYRTAMALPGSSDVLELPEGIDYHDGEVATHASLGDIPHVPSTDPDALPRIDKGAVIQAIAVELKRIDWETPKLQAWVKDTFDIEISPNKDGKIGASLKRALSDNQLIKLFEHLQSLPVPDSVQTVEAEVVA
jgi:hypothetical protein